MAHASVIRTFTLSPVATFDAVSCSPHRGERSVFKPTKLLMYCHREISRIAKRVKEE